MNTEITCPHCKATNFQASAQLRNAEEKLNNYFREQAHLERECAKNFKQAEKFRHALLELEEWADSAIKEWSESVDMEHGRRVIKEALLKL